MRGGGGGWTPRGPGSMPTSCVIEVPRTSASASHGWLLLECISPHEPCAASWDSLLPGVDAAAATAALCGTVEQLPAPPTEETNVQLTEPSTGLLASIKAKGARAAGRTCAPTAGAMPIPTAVFTLGGRMRRARVDRVLDPPIYVADSLLLLYPSAQIAPRAALPMAGAGVLAAHPAHLLIALHPLNPPSAATCRLPGQHVCQVGGQGDAVPTPVAKPGTGDVRLRGKGLRACLLPQTKHAAASLRARRTASLPNAPARQLVSCSSNAIAAPMFSRSTFVLCLYAAMPLPGYCQ